MALIFFTLIPQAHRLAAASCSSRWRWDSVCVITCKHNTGQHSRQGSTGGRSCSVNWRGLMEKRYLHECVGYPGEQHLQVWTQDHSTPGAQCCSPRTLPAWSWVTVSVEETSGGYLAVGLAPYPLAHRWATCSQAGISCRQLCATNLGNITPMSRTTVHGLGTSTHHGATTALQCKWTGEIMRLGVRKTTCVVCNMVSDRKNIWAGPTCRVQSSMKPLPLTVFKSSILVLTPSSISRRSVADSGQG